MFKASIVEVEPEAADRYPGAAAWVVAKANTWFREAMTKNFSVCLKEILAKPSGDLKRGSRTWFRLRSAGEELLNPSNMSSVEEAEFEDSGEASLTCLSSSDHDIQQTDGCGASSDAAVVPERHGEKGDKPEGKAFDLSVDLRTNPHL